MTKAVDKLTERTLARSWATSLTATVTVPSTEARMVSIGALARALTSATAFPIISVICSMRGETVAFVAFAPVSESKSEE